MGKDNLLSVKSVRIINKMPIDVTQFPMGDGKHIYRRSYTEQTISWEGSPSSISVTSVMRGVGVLKMPINVTQNQFQC